jgi:RNA polymerase sigma factor (sigma-70 family)
MATRLNPVLRHLRRLAAPAGSPADADAALLDRFVRLRDEGAFAALIRRHGPMALNVARRVLGDAHAAQDATQAAFLVLARKADSLRRPDALAAWLYGVAYRTARSTRRRLARRHAQALPEGEAAPPAPSPDPLEQVSGRELLLALEEEVQRLPEAYRLPVVLVCLEGLSREEAARRLGCTPGAVKGRLERGRKRLHERLAKRGLTLAAALAAVEVSREAAGAPAVLAAATARAAVVTMAGGVGVGCGPLAKVGELAAGVLPEAGLARRRLALVLALVLGLAALGAGVLGQARQQEPPPLPGGQPVGDPARPKAAGAKPPAADLHGDPLPPGAVVRLGTVRLRHSSPVHAFEFAPGGKIMASAGDDAVRLWDTATGRQLRRLAPGAGCIAFSPDGSLLATGGYDGRVRLWEAGTGRPLRQLDPGSDIYTLAFAPDGTTLASGGRAGAISLDDLATGKRLHQWRVPGRLASVAFSPDGKLLASATTGGVVQVWDVATRTESPPFRGRKLSGIRVAFSPDGRFLASAPTSGGFGGLWEVSGGKEVRREARGYPDLAFAPDGRTLAAPDGDAVRLWEATTGKPVAALAWGRRPAAHVRFSPDGKYLAAAGGGGPAVTVWELATGHTVSPLPGHRDPIRAVAFAPDGRTLAAVESGGEGPGAVTLWEVSTGRELRRLPGPGGHAPAVRFAQAGREVVAGPDPAGAVRRWEAGTGKELPFVAGLTRKPARALAVSPEGQALAVSSSARSVHIYDCRSGKERRTLGLTAGEGYVLALSPSGRLLGYLDGADAAVLVDTASGKALHRCRHEGVRALTFSPDGRLLATGGSGPIRLWGVATGKALSSVPGHGEAGQTTAVAFSPDGRTLASSGSDGTLRVWELASRGQRQLFRPAQPASCLTFSSDGRLLASGGFDTTVLVWNLTSRSGGQRQ